MISARERRARALPENRARFPRQELNRPAKGSPCEESLPRPGEVARKCRKGAAGREAD